jgi:ubiquinone/menaquinone biosynthesis C-methylase UbiE
MDRATWLAERRAAVRAEYDDEAPSYDDAEYPVPLHLGFVAKLLSQTRAGGRVLDAPCGTGRWFGPVVESGRSVVGVDQSSGMLEQARAKGLAEDLNLVGLQELPFVSEFDAAMTIDALENVPPEEWPLVVANVRRALKSGAPWYLTIEESDEAVVDDAFARHTAEGLPIVRGEVIEGDVAGYHYYPGRDRALAWLAEAGFAVVDEAFDQQEGWGYRHLIVRAG